MRRFFSIIFKKIAEMLEKEEISTESLKEEKRGEEILPKVKAVSKKGNQRKKTEVISSSERSLRDFTEMMENPFLALSKNRKNPIFYESPDGTRKIKVTRHTGHFLASIYDWDIIIFIESKMQEILNSRSDIPPRTMVFPRHEILKSLHKHDGKKEEKDLKASLARLKMTGIETTIRNADSRYEAGFGFLDSWGYTERKEVKEIRITLSQWLYDGICAQGVLLKVSPSYFDITSALKRFLYRTARKHVGKNKNSWEFSVEKLYAKSGSEREFKKFKSDLKSAVLDDNIPDYSMEWIEKNKKAFVVFKDEKIPKTDDRFEEVVENNKNALNSIR